MNSSPNSAVWAGGILAAFFAGSIPTGYLMVKSLKGQDIREQGSTNTGATNVLRVAGKVPALLTLLIDILKGFIPVLISFHFFPTDKVFAAATGMAAICGHNWTPFLGFKGGKGTATSIGAFLALLPIPSLVALGCFLLSISITRIVSLSSLIGAVGMCVGAALFARSAFFTGLAVAATLILFVLHRKNIERLLKGEEPKIP